MKINKIISQHRRDFVAIYECEFCNHSEEGSGYDDRYFHDNVIPDLKCNKCGRSTFSEGGEVTYRETKYPEDYQI